MSVLKDLNPDVITVWNLLTKGYHTLSSYSSFLIWKESKFEIRCDSTEQKEKWIHFTNRKLTLPSGFKWDERRDRQQTYKNITNENFSIFFISYIQNSYIQIHMCNKNGYYLRTEFLRFTITSLYSSLSFRRLLIETLDTEQ